MRRVQFDPSTHLGIDAEEWARWETRAREATRAVHDWLAAMATPPTPLDLKPAIWSALKEIVLEKVFRGRCSFCEVDEFVGGFGDAEHYRPKRSVEAPNLEGKMKPITVGAAKHPGYTWLAYDWQNLVPACSKCNTYKANQFPVANAHCVRPAVGCETTTELNAYEQPLLLHPYFDDPGEHLEVGEQGVIAAKSPRGQATIEVCRLNRDPLKDARAREQRSAWREVKELMDEGRKVHEAIQTLQDRCHAGDEKFSLAITDYLWARLTEHVEEQKARLLAAEKLLASRRS